MKTIFAVKTSFFYRKVRKENVQFDHVYSIDITGVSALLLLRYLKNRRTPKKPLWVTSVGVRDILTAMVFSFGRRESKKMVPYVATNSVSSS